MSEARRYISKAVAGLHRVCSGAWIIRLGVEANERMARKQHGPISSAVAGVSGLILVSNLAFAQFKPKDAVLAWDYPTNQLSTNLWFILHSTNDITAPLTNWPSYAMVSGTNLTVTVPMTSGWRFFYVTASNEWGESLPSNTVTTLVATTTSNLTIQPK